ncbi:MAG: hypothetical protein LUD82_08680 [Clostridiales bacterium]|nr:hypothetical protein [Clostridiales bacterium]
MCKRFDEWSEHISDYCAKNGLSFEKAKRMVQSSNENVLVLQYYDPTKEASQGLLDETPMPVVLWVTRENGQLKFEQTEHTSKYLAQ